MNKLLKYSLAVAAVLAVVFYVAVSFGITAGTLAITSSTLINTNTNTVVTVNQVLVSNVAGVATVYTNTTITTTTVSKAICPYNDNNLILLVQNQGPVVCTAIVSYCNPVLGTNGWLLPGGGSLTFPLSGGGGAPAQLFASTVAGGSNGSVITVQQLISGTGAR